MAQEEQNKAQEEAQKKAREEEQKQQERQLKCLEFEAAVLRLQAQTLKTGSTAGGTRLCAKQGSRWKDSVPQWLSCNFIVALQRSERGLGRDISRNNHTPIFLPRPRSGVRDGWNSILRSKEAGLELARKYLGYCRLRALR